MLETTNPTVTAAATPVSPASAPRVLLLHFPSLDNYGTAMMGLNAVHYLRRELAVSLSADFATDFDHDELRGELGSSAADVANFAAVKEVAVPQSRLARRARTLWRFLKADEWREFDAVAVLGGDDLSEYYTRSIWLTILRYGLAARRKPFVLLNQTIGPFPTFRNRLACRVFLRFPLVLCRDSWTVDYLRTLGLKAQLGADLAFLDLPRQHDTALEDEILRRYELKQGEYATVVISALQDQAYYTSDRERYVGVYAQVVQGLLDRPQMQGRKVCLLAHTFGRYGDEAALIRSVANQLPEAAKKRVMVVAEKILPTRARFILGNGLFTITGRMHAAVSTFQMGRPALSIAYSKKYEGVIGQGLGRQDLILEANDPQLWNGGGITSRIAEKVDYIFANYPRLRDEIARAVAGRKALALESLRQTVRHIQGANR